MTGTLITSEVDFDANTARTAMGAANRKGVVNVMAELGGAGCVTPDILRRTERGLRRILHALGMLPGYVANGAQGTRAVTYPSGNHALGVARAAQILGSSAMIVMPSDAPDAIPVPCGGGGLTAAKALVMAGAHPATQVHTAEPALFDDTRRCLEAGKRLPDPTGRRAICDAIMTPTSGKMTFAINRDLLTGGVTATDAEVRDAMRFACEHFKIVTEPGAVVGLAAILNGQVPIAGRTVVTVVTGGHIDAARFATLLEDSE